MAVWDIETLSRNRDSGYVKCFALYYLDLLVLCERKDFQTKSLIPTCELNNNNKHQNSHGSIYLLVVSTHLKNISQNGSFPQIGVNIKNIWNHQLLVVISFHSEFASVFQKLKSSNFMKNPPVWRKRWWFGGSTFIPSSRRCRDGWLERWLLRSAEGSAIFGRNRFIPKKLHLLDTVSVGWTKKNIFPQMGGLNEIMEKSAESKNFIFESYLGWRSLRRGSKFVFSFGVSIIGIFLKPTKTLWHTTPQEHDRIRRRCGVHGGLHSTTAAGVHHRAVVTHGGLCVKTNRFGPAPGHPSFLQLCVCVYVCLYFP